MLHFVYNLRYKYSNKEQSIQLYEKVTGVHTPPQQVEILLLLFLILFQ